MKKLIDGRPGKTYKEIVKTLRKKENVEKGFYTRFFPEEYYNEKHLKGVQTNLNRRGYMQVLIKKEGGSCIVVGKWKNRALFREAVRLEREDGFFMKDVIKFVNRHENFDISRVKGRGVGNDKTVILYNDCPVATVYDNGSVSTYGNRKSKPNSELRELMKLLAIA